MTNEELRAMLMRQQGGLSGQILPMSPAMNNSGVPSAEQRAKWEAQAAYDPSAKEAQMAQMLRGGQEALFDTPMPQGRMMGDIYAAPTWADSLNAGVARALGGYQMGRARKGQDEIQTKRDAAAKSGGLAKAAALAEAQAQRNFENDVSTQGLRLDQETLTQRASEGALDRGAQAEEARLTREAAAAAARLATDSRRAESMKPSNYVIDGKVRNVVWDSTGQPRLGSVDGGIIPPETMARAVEYRPGTDKGTLGDAGSFSIDPADQGEAPVSFMGNLLNSDYFDKSTGVFNPERWAGALGAGPDGDMVKATQSQMSTATLAQIAQRMEDINLRPWTPEEIKTISADFPSANSKYPDWANFSYNLLAPKLSARYDEAIEAGRSTPEAKAAGLEQLINETIEGARKNGMKLTDLEQLGVPRETIQKYLRSIR